MQDEHERFVAVSGVCRLRRHAIRSAEANLRYSRSRRGTIGPMVADENDGSLGAVLVLLHDADAPAETVDVSYRVWRHQTRLNEAFAADAEALRRRGASISTFSVRGSDEPEPDEREETLRIWRDGERVREEHHGGERDGAYAVVDPPFWWMWNEHVGARSNQDEPDVGSNIGHDMDFMLDPAPLLSVLRFAVTGTSEVAGRATTTVTARPRPTDPRSGMSMELSRLGSGADRYELEIDHERGVLLAVSAFRHDLPFHRITTLAIAFGLPIAPERFRFQPPEGEEITSPRDHFRHRNVTLVEAQQQTPFTVLVMDSVPESWQQMHCSYTEASQRPLAVAQLQLDYRSGDGHEGVHMTQKSSADAGPDRRANEGDDWDEVARAGKRVRTRPAGWGQAQVELERNGTYVFLMSENLTRDQLVNIAFNLRPAPDTSSIS
jgi:hypothetical protein